MTRFYQHPVLFQSRVREKSHQRLAVNWTKFWIKDRNISVQGEIFKKLKGKESSMRFSGLFFLSLATDKALVVV